MSARRIRVLCVDDHPVVRNGVEGMLKAESDLEWIGDAPNGAIAIELCLSLSPDVVLIDLRLPDMAGMTVIERVLSKQPGIGFCALTTYAGDVRIRRTLTAGARGYLLKSMSNAVITEAVREIAAGRSVVPHEIAADLAAHTRFEPLTGRELDVLRLMADGLSNKSIARALDLSDSTVRSHVEHVLAKLGCNHRTEAANQALRRGFIDVSGLIS